jgi:ubiquinone biosynthesis monooxygenase Coq7
MGARSFGLLDRIIGEIDIAIKVLAVPARSVREAPPVPGGELVLTEGERLESSRLMRVNHAGEVAAQALYRGQALSARDPSASAAMRQSAAEEMDHLAWCEGRLNELNGRTSLLNPLWYAGSWAIGALAGAFGDRISLGFIRETERQVESHLRGHLDRLPAADRRSRSILEQKAGAGGATELPFPLRAAMRLASRVMTRSSYWL